MLTEVGLFPIDESPYGIRDLAGSMGDWCSDVFVEAGPLASSARREQHTAPTRPGGSPADPVSVQDISARAPIRVGRGGCWRDGASYMRASYRDRNAMTHRFSNLGFRLVRPAR